MRPGPSEPCSCGGACACGCCEGTEPLTPRAIWNRPGLDALAYRAGTHSGFLETMKARLSSRDFPALGKLTGRETSDVSIALLDAWATVADVLTFYQERIANEGYLRTATERRSVLELARLVGYAPRPGVAASTYLAYTVDPGPETVIPAGAAARSVPGPGEEAQTFETAEDLAARADWNRLQVRLTRPQQPEEFEPAAVSAWPVPLYLQGISTQLKPNDPLLIDLGTESAPRALLYRVLSVTPDSGNDRTRVGIEPWQAPEPPAPSNAIRPGTTTQISDVLGTLGKPPRPQVRNSAHLDRDAATLLAPGSDLTANLLAVARPELREVLWAAWANVPVTERPRLKVYALRARASVFGHNAPLESIVEREGGQVVDMRFEEWTTLQEEAAVAWLDAPYPQVLPGSWIVLHKPRGVGQIPELVVTRVERIAGRSRASYGVSAKASRVELGDPWLDLDVEPDDQRDTFATLRGTAVFAHSEELPLAETPLTRPLCGGEIELAALYDGLRPGRWLIVAGERTDVGAFDEAGNVEAPVPGVPAAELVMLAGVSQGVQSRFPVDPAIAGGAAGTPSAPDPLPGERTHTTVTLDRPLAYCYRRDSVAIYGNVVRATHGETRFEVLGGGDATRAFQSFALKQPPLTWVSAPTPSGVESTLEVRVDDVRWRLADSVAALGTADRGYVLRTDDGGRTTVVFGNGERGARLPSGAENVRATYRSGIGRAGNVGKERISQLATRPLGVKDVINPLPAGGGADRESRDQARRNAPLAVLALDRLISVQDYADFARTFAGVGKASAARLTDGRVEFVHVTIAGEDDIPIREDSDLFLNLERALRRFGDPRQPLRLAVRKRAFLVVEAEVRVLPDHLWEAVAPRIRAALLEAFGFDRRDLGQDALLSEVYRVVQGVRGVDLVDVDLFARKDPEDLSAALDQGTRPVDAEGDVRDLPAPRLRADLARIDRAGAVQPAQILYLTPEVADTLILKERTS